MQLLTVRGLLIMGYDTVLRNINIIDCNNRADADYIVRQRLLL